MGKFTRASWIKWQLTLILGGALSACVLIWYLATKPMMKPVVNHLGVVDVVKAIQILEQHDIEVLAKAETGTLWVNKAQLVEAKIALKSIGIELASQLRSDHIAKAIADGKAEQAKQPVYTQPWFMDIMRYVLASLVSMSLIFKIIGPIVTRLNDELDRSSQAIGNKGHFVSDVPALLMSLKFSKAKILGVFLVVCVLILVRFIFVYKQPEFRPLINDLRQVDGVKVADLFDQNRVHYWVDHLNHILYVNKRSAEQARLVLAANGIVIEYPNLQGPAKGQLNDNQQSQQTN